MSNLILQIKYEKKKVKESIILMIVIKKKNIL